MILASCGMCIHEERNEDQKLELLSKGREKQETKGVMTIKNDRKKKKRFNHTIIPGTSKTEAAIPVCQIWHTLQKDKECSYGRQYLCCLWTQ